MGVAMDDLEIPVYRFPYDNFENEVTLALKWLEMYKDDDGYFEIPDGEDDGYPRTWAEVKALAATGERFLAGKEVGGGLLWEILEVAQAQEIQEAETTTAEAAIRAKYAILQPALKNSMVVRA